MQSISLDISDCNPPDFTIIYKGGKGPIIEIKTFKDEFIHKLRYFQQKKAEINYVDEYYIHDTFDTSLFREFINTLHTKKLVINNENYLDYYKLSRKYEYNELTSTIVKFISNRPDLKDIFDQLLSQNTENTNENTSESDENECNDEVKEKLISKNLDYCLKNFDISKLPIRAIIRIINSPDRVVNDHHMLFEFVMRKIKEIRKIRDEDNNDEIEYDIGAMISSLDLKEMTADEVEELINYGIKSQVFSPRHSNEIIETLFTANKKNDAKIQSIENKLESLQNKFVQQVQENEELKQKIEKLEQFQHQKNIEIEENLNQKSEEIQKVIKDISLNQQKIAEYQENLIKESINIKEIELQHKKIKEEYKQNYEKCQTNISQIQTIINKHEEIINNQNKKVPIKSSIKGEMPKTEESEEKKNIQQKVIKEFKQKNPNEFDGIMKYLNDKTGGNIHDNKTIEITSNNISSLDCYVDYIEKFNGHSSSKGNTYICFDFKEKQVLLESYSILSFGNDRGFGQIKNWVIEISNDGSKWNEIDRHQDDSTLNKQSIVGTFKIQKQQNSFYRFIRIRQTGKSWDPSDHQDFGFNLIDFYGKLQES